MRRAAKTSLRITVVRPLLATLLAATAGGGLWAADNPPPAPRPTSAPVAPTPAAPVAPVAAKPPEIPAKPVIAAKTLFSAAKTPAPIEARAIGFYSRGCLAGGQALPINGAEWQAMRLSRNRFWGHPNLVSFLQRFAEDARRLDGWPGLLVGDMSQPRGGPMESSHASHQVGLDVDIWYDPMPARRLTAAEREEKSASNMRLGKSLDLDPKLWTPDHVRLLKRAASFGEVERVFVHPTIKKALCEATVNDPDRTWLAKMRPIWGHDDHFHVRIRCPEGAVGCEAQPLPTGDDGCGKELLDWYALLTAPPKPPAPKSDVPPPQPLTLDKLPADCRTVLEAPLAAKAVPVAQPK